MDDTIRIYGWMHRMELNATSMVMFALIYDRAALCISPIVTYEDFMSATGASKTTVIRLLKDMIEKNYISQEAVVTDVGSYYRYRPLVDENTFKEVM